MLIYGNSLGCYSGAGGEVWNGSEWVTISKAEITEKLRQGALKVLVCTDAASEGLNLQAASALINYDMPWNPSKVEQRIGRIDRIGQSQDCLPIRNMFLNNSVDMRVYQVLQERCQLFHQFVGRAQPVLALARDALRREREDAFFDEIDRSLAEAEKDSAIANVFMDAEVDVPEVAEPGITRADIEEALGLLQSSDTKVSAKKVRGRQSWKLTGLGGKGVEATVMREELERFDHVLPLTPGFKLVDKISERLPLPANRTPLVIADCSDGSFKAVEVRWVQGEHFDIIRNVIQLQRFIAAWDGGHPAPVALHKAQEEARTAARQRVQIMKDEALTREKTALEAQLLSARKRLRMELGRTLRCLTQGDLIQAFQIQINREARPDGRYHQAFQLFGGWPDWTSAKLAEIEIYVRELKTNQRKVRITGTEIDAALNDPRWSVRKI